MTLYVYCVLPGSSPVVESLIGIQNQPTRIIDIDSLRVIVSSFSGSELIATKENVFVHERVVEHCMNRVTPLPFRFGAVVPETKLRAFICSNMTALNQDLESVEGCVEMGLKVMFGNDTANAPGSVTGTEFLNAKRRSRRVQQDTAAWVEAAAVGLVRRTDVSLLQGTASTIVRIAHLVHRDHLNVYKSHIDTLVRERTNCRFLRSGPWPPYSFVSTFRVD